MIFTVPMWGSEVVNSKTEIHLTNTTSEAMRVCNVATIEHEGDRHMLLRLVEVVRRSCRRPVGTKYPAKYVGSVVYRSVSLYVRTSVSHYYYLVYDCTPCFLPTIVEDVVVLWMSRLCLVLLLAVLMKTCPTV